MKSAFLAGTLAFACLSTLVATPDHVKAAEDKLTDLRLLDPAIFGKRTFDPIALLQPEQPGKLDPETVMVDIENGKYNAATVRYPKEMSLEEARQSINRVYKKWEKASFADDPDMGLWRNEDQKFAIQLSDDGFNIVVIYISFASVTDRQLMRGLSRATQMIENEDRARQAVSEMGALLKQGDFQSFYRIHCHRNFRKQLDQPQFIDMMQSDRGKAMIALVAAVDDAIQKQQGQDTLIARFNDDDVDTYEIILVRARNEREAGPMWRIELKKADSKWKLSDFE